MKIGQMVTLRAYGNTELVRRIVGINNDVVSVCRPEEYERANKAGREPISVGFRIKDVIKENS
jgi:hypothetical protein